MHFMCASVNAYIAYVNCLFVHMSKQLHVCVCVWVHVKTCVRV